MYGVVEFVSYRSYNGLDLEYFRRPEDVRLDRHGAVDGHGVGAVRVDEELDGRLEVLRVEVGDDEHRSEQIGHLVAMPRRAERHQLRVHLRRTESTHSFIHLYSP